MAPSMFPPPMQDTGCSGPRPPNTTATLILRCSLTNPPVPVSVPAVPYAGDAPASDAVTLWLGRPAGQQQDRLPDFQPFVHDPGDHLGDRHLHAVLRGPAAAPTATTCTPSTVWVVLASTSASGMPRPSFSPKARFLASGELQLATRSPMPARPGERVLVGAERGAEPGDLGQPPGDQHRPGVVAQPHARRRCRRRSRSRS